MSANSTEAPIGIFDSGVGGLTVAREVVKLLPKENVVYFGDIAHLPYGDKSTAAIQSYSIKITQMLLEQQCKLILIACHTASAAAYELVKEYVGSKALVMNVIDPVVYLLQKSFAGKHVGLIGTKSTVRSNVYKKRIDELGLNITFSSLATALLVPAIEEGFRDSKIIDSILEEYLSKTALSTIDALILGCTHYPIVKKKISDFYQNSVELIDPSEQVAQAVKARLLQNDWLNKNNTQPTKQFFVSDYTTAFVDNARLFFNEDISLMHYPLWD